MPRIITARQLGLHFDNRFGAMGDEKFVTGHYTAGPVDRSDSDCERLLRAYHQAHRAKGWGGIGYTYCIARSGRVYGLRPTALKGAHTGGANTGNVGVVFHGTTGDKPNAAQSKSYRWLLANAHTRRMPAAHRTDRDLRNAFRLGHNDWESHKSNGCPGAFKPLIVKGFR